MMSSALKQKRLSFSEKIEIFVFRQSDNIGVCTVVEKCKVRIVDSVSNKNKIYKT